MSKQVLVSAGAGAGAAAVMPTILPASAPDRNAMRLAIATSAYPLTLFLASALVIGFSLLTLITEDRVPVTHVVDGAIALVLMGAAVLLQWGDVRPQKQPWIFATVGCLFALALLYKVTIEQDPMFLPYVVIVLCAFGPSTLAWGPFLAASAVVILATGPMMMRWPDGHWLDWTVTLAAATSVSCVLLNARIRGINALADTNALARRLATTDQLTGLLNRHGFMERLPSVTAHSDRLDMSVFVAFVDIRGLKRANDQLGHEFGDHVIQAAARAVTKSVRADDLVVRWGGDEVVVVGLGRIPEAESFNDRLRSQHEWTGEDKAKWSGDLSVGFAEGLLSLESIDDIIGRADEDMYRRRRTTGHPG